MGFAPINTQEEFDAAISERLKREKEKYSGYLSPEDERKKYSGYLSPEAEKEKYGGYLSPEEAKERYGGYLSPEDVEKKYSGYLSPEEAAKKDKQIKDYEIGALKSRVAREMNLPWELADRLSGETEDDIRKDAKLLSGIVGSRKGSPGKSTEPSTTGTDKNAAYRELLNKMKGN